VTAAFSGTAMGSPGAVMTLYGANLAGSLVQAAGFPMPFSLGNVTMVTGNTYTPLYYVSPGQINFQIPYSVATGNVNIRVYQGVRVTSANVTIAAVSPALFSINQQGSGQGSIRIANSAAVACPVGSIAGVDCQPAKRGGFIEVYGTGMGAVTPAAPTGNVPISLSSTRLTPTAMVGGLPANVIFSGLNPGAAGLYQINVQIPAGVTPGDAVPVSIMIGGVTSNTVTVAVQ
jgi:uncharacterized protein (TIGR03437 family)